MSLSFPVAVETVGSMSLTENGHLLTLVLPSKIPNGVLGIPIPGYLRNGYWACSWLS